MKRKKELTWFQRHILCDIQTYCVLHTEFEKYHPIDFIRIEGIMIDKITNMPYYKIVTSIRDTEYNENRVVWSVSIGLNGKSDIFLLRAFGE